MFFSDDGNFCLTGKVTCENNGTCLNAFKNPDEKCICTPGYRSKNCSEGKRTLFMYHLVYSQNI